MTSTPSPIRLAIWSGPRNISTALMRAWENRADTIVHDEPFYAHYLDFTGRQHPGRVETLARHTTDWRSVIRELRAPAPQGVDIVYQKHMAHHLLPHIHRDWIAEMTHGFLIREPRDMLASLTKHLPEVSIEETGLPQQVRLFRQIVSQSGSDLSNPESQSTRGRGLQLPVVLDARDVLAQPEAMLRRLCQVIDVRFDPRMLHWPVGPRASDGAWGPYWYQEVYRTTTFAPPRTAEVALDDRYAALLRECEPLYQELYQSRLTI